MKIFSVTFENILHQNKQSVNSIDFIYFHVNQIMRERERERERERDCIYNQSSDL